MVSSPWSLTSRERLWASQPPRWVFLGSRVLLGEEQSERQGRVKPRELLRLRSELLEGHGKGSRLNTMLTQSCLVCAGHFGASPGKSGSAHLTDQGVPHGADLEEPGV